MTSPEEWVASLAMKNTHKNVMHVMDIVVIHYCVVVNFSNVMMTFYNLKF